MRVWSVAQVNRSATPTGRAVQVLPSAIRISNNVWPSILIKLWVCTGMQGLRTNQIANTSAGIEIHCRDGLPAPELVACHFSDCVLFFSMLRLWGCQRSAKLLTFSLWWKSDSCNSLECIRVFPEDTLLSVFKTRFVLFRFSVLNSSFLFCFIGGSNVNTRYTLFFFFSFFFLYAELKFMYFFIYIFPFWNKISLIYSFSVYFFTCSEELFLTFCEAKLIIFKFIVFALYNLKILNVKQASCNNLGLFCSYIKSYANIDRLCKTSVGNNRFFTGFIII